MSLLDDSALKSDLQEWLVGPLNLLHIVFVEILPGIVFIGLLWVGGDDRITSAMSNGMFGYKTKVVLLLAGCYVVGKLLPIPWLLLAGCLKLLAFAIKKKQAVAPLPPSSGFNKWYSSQNPHVKKIIDSLAIAPLYLGKRNFSYLLSIAHAEMAFYVAMGNACLLAAVIRPASPFKKWEILIGISAFIAGVFGQREYQEFIPTVTILATTDKLASMSPEERAIVFNAFKKFASIFSPAADQVVQGPPVESSEANKSQGANVA